MQAVKPDHDLFKDLSREFSLIRLTGKKPKESEWQRFCRQKREFEEIGFCSGDNAGIACGPASNLLVVDVDNQELFESVCNRHGWHVPGDTRVHITGSGKPHILFKYQANGKPTGNKTMKVLGFDVRGDGGQVVAPGSIHPETGGIYEVLQANEPLSPPDWLMDLYHADNPGWTTIQVDKLKVSDDTKKLIKEGVPKGERSEAMQTVLAALCGSAKLSDDQVYYIFYTFPIGEKFRSVRPNRDQWLKRQIDKARRYVDSHPLPVDVADVGEGFLVTEDAIAQVFADRFKDDLRYCNHTGAWFRWNGYRWEKEETKLAFSWARSLCRELCRKSKNVKVVSAFSKAATAAAVERFAQADRAFSVTSVIWDQDPWLLGTPGGVVDLRSGEMRPSERLDHLTKAATVTPSLSSKAPLWERFLAETTNQDMELQRFLQQMAGYCLTGDISEHALFFVYGPGGNGKSVFLNTLVNIIGDYAKTSAMDTFTASKHDRHPTDLAMLKGARLVSVSETEEGRAWAESRIKQLTGGDKVSARFMRQDFFDFKPQFKLLIIGNHKPVLRNVDDAAKRRFNIIPFIHKPESPDHQLEKKLQTEYPAILRWMIEGCLDWQRNGLVRPPVVTEATKAYFEDQDLFGQWLEECCEIGPREWEVTSRLYGSWKDYAERSGESPGGMKAFTGNLIKREFVPYRATIHGSQQRAYRGVSLKAKDEARNPYAE